MYREAEEIEYEILPTEIVQVKAADGTLLYARLIKPAGFAAGKKYPVIVDGLRRPGRAERAQCVGGRHLGPGAGAARIS